MPYTGDKGKLYMHSEIEQIVLETAGDLNRAFTEILKLYEAKHKRCYQTANDIIGALEGAKIEYYRRVVAPYEDEKRQSNGDVY